MEEKQNAITNILNKEFFGKQVFSSKEYDQQIKKEMREMMNVVDDNPWGAEMLLKTLHKNFTKAIKRKDRDSELYAIHRFYFLMFYAKNKLEPETWDKINKEMGKDWKGILYDVKNK